MKIDFERMELARKSSDRGIGKTFVSAWDAIEQLPECKVMVWEIPFVGWIDHIVDCIAQVCSCKELDIRINRFNGKVKVVIITKQKQDIGVIHFSHYKDTIEHFRGMRYRKVNDYGKLALHLERMREL